MKDVDFTAFRQRLLGSIDPDRQGIPSQPSVAFAWPTETCSIGCAHCSYGSKRGSPASQLSAHMPELVEWLCDAGVHRLVVCGGGEPLDCLTAVNEAVTSCARRGLDFEIYTSGRSKTDGLLPFEYIEAWKNLWQGNPRRFAIRLSCDAFHEELLGVDILRDWVVEVARRAPEWQISVRGLDVEHDASIQHLASALNGTVLRHNRTTGVIKHPLGSLPFRLKGFVLEGRGSVRQLRRLGLTLPQAQVETLSASGSDQSRAMGRPFSLRFAMSRQRVDLEIRSDCVVHMLQSQAPDLRLRFLDSRWEEIRGVYFRDPLLHLTIDGGLEAVAAILRKLRDAGVAPATIPLYSIEGIPDVRTLAYASAMAVLERRGFHYDDDLVQACAEFLRVVDLSPGVGLSA